MNIYAYATKYTRDILDGKKNPERDMTNRKPYRSKSLRTLARETAWVSQGAYVSDVQVLYHLKPKTTQN